MKKSALTRLATAFIMLPIASTPSFGSGNDILRQCNGVVQVMKNEEPSSSQLEMGQCLGFIDGIRYTTEIYQEIFTEAKLVCIPKTVENGQIARIVVKYMNENPKYLHENEMVATMFALQKSFPCKSPSVNRSPKPTR